MMPDTVLLQTIYHKLNRFRNFTNMFEELTNFGVSGHDDCVDALVWLVNGLARKGQLHLDF